jgi:hypothetical protein
MSLIQQRYWDQLSLGELARHVGMSKHRLSHRFREVWALPRDYLLQVRLERATSGGPPFHHRGRPRCRLWGPAALRQDVQALHWRHPLRLSFVEPSLQQQVATIRQQTTSHPPYPPLT